MQLKRPLIVGCKGAMGRRYTAVLRHLGVSPLGMDQDDIFPEAGFDSVLLATPTAIHVDDIKFFMGLGLPILCEKPLTVSLSALRELASTAEDYPLRMVNQYEYLDSERSEGLTQYNYYNHGRDSLAWDCINIIGMARGIVALQEISPIWTCWLNGSVLSLSDMDHAYIEMLRSWLGGNVANVPYFIKAHEKVEEYIQACKRPF